MSAQILVLVALVALLVGATLPVLFQLRATLREMERRLQGLGERLDLILRDSQLVASRLARVSSGLDGGEESIRNLMEAVGRLSKMTTRTAGWMGLATSLGTVIGPALAAALQSYRSSSAVPDEVPIDDIDDREKSSQPGSWASPSDRSEGREGMHRPTGDASLYRGFAGADNNQREQQRGAEHER